MSKVTMWRSRWKCVIKPAYSFSFLLSINIFVWQNVLYFIDAPRRMYIVDSGVNGDTPFILRAWTLQFEMQCVLFASSCLTGETVTSIAQLVVQERKFLRLERSVEIPWKIKRVEGRWCLTAAAVYSKAWTQSSSAFRMVATDRRGSRHFITNCMQ